jgi:hypothetical protein
MISITQLSDEQLRVELLEKYAHLERYYPEMDAVKTLKAELYRRGYQREDIIQIALTSLIRLQHQAN